jgi:hypothetical protein
MMGERVKVALPKRNRFALGVFQGFSSGNEQSVVTMDEDGNVEGVDTEIPSVNVALVLEKPKDKVLPVSPQRPARIPGMSSRGRLRTSIHFGDGACRQEFEDSHEDCDAGGSRLGTQHRDKRQRAGPAVRNSNARAGRMLEPEQSTASFKATTVLPLGSGSAPDGNGTLDILTPDEVFQLEREGLSDASDPDMLDISRECEVS